ncbi:MAG TPA: hypothetical protein VGM26_18915 [Rhizomicrobium sp.]|jgi:hypothetical protein
MKFATTAALLGGMTLSACAGPQGNPNGLPYANEEGGVIAVQPQTVGNVAYNPYAPSPSFADMQSGQAAIAPPPPLNMPMPAR